MNSFSKIHMPELICGRGSVSFLKTLNKKRAAILGYDDGVQEMAAHIFADTDTEVRYIATISREPTVDDLFGNLAPIREFEPEL